MRDDDDFGDCVYEEKLSLQPSLWEAYAYWTYPNQRLLPQLWNIVYEYEPFVRCLDLLFMYDELGHQRMCQWVKPNGETWGLDKSFLLPGTDTTTRAFRQCINVRDFKDRLVPDPVYHVGYCGSLISKDVLSLYYIANYAGVHSRLSSRQQSSPCRRKLLIQNK